MKIDDPKAFYEFFSSLNLPGIIAIIIMAALVVAYFTSTIVEKLFKSTQKKAKMILIISSTSAIVLCGVLLKADADKAKKDLIIANTIKSYLIANDQKFKSFKGLAKELYLEPSDTRRDSAGMAKRYTTIVDIVENYPGEFITSKVDEIDSLGIELIDDKATKMIDSSLKKKQPYFQSKIVYYMTMRGETRIKFDVIKDSIDDRLYDPDIINSIIANSNGVLIPYSEVNPKETDEFIHYLVKQNGKLPNK